MTVLKKKMGGSLQKYIIILFSLIQLHLSPSHGAILPDTNQYAFTITIRFKVKENIADLYC